MIADEPTMTIPLRTDEHGAIRIGNARVTLDSIINFYLQGESPEDLHAGFPTVPLSDIYAVIAYYLSHRAEVDSYLKRRNDEAEQIIKDIEANLTPEARALRTRLRAFQEQQKYGPCSGS